MRRLAVVVVCLAAIVPPAVASEHDRPPATVLKATGVHQKARIGSYCWSWDNGDGSGSAQCADYFGYRWPRAQRGMRAGEATITIRHPEQPTQVDYTYWRRVDEEGFPRGEGQTLAYALAPRSVGDEMVWDVSFVLPDYHGRFYLSGHLQWDNGDASYYSKLRLR